MSLGALADWLVQVLLEDEQRLADPTFCAAPWPTADQLIKQTKVNRAIVEIFTAVDADPSRYTNAGVHLQHHAMGKVVQIVGTAYADRPGYRQEWKP